MVLPRLIAPISEPGHRYFGSRLCSRFHAVSHRVLPIKLPFGHPPAIGVTTITTSPGGISLANIADRLTLLALVLDDQILEMWR
jgi:hypothetical protein